jgi:hypothetical protein
VQEEWQRFANAHPNAEGLKARIAQELATSPSKPGEKTADAIKRAYKAVTAEPGKKTREPKNWREEAGKAWEQLSALEPKWRLDGHPLWGAVADEKL